MYFSGSPPGWRLLFPALLLCLCLPLATSAQELVVPDLREEAVNETTDILAPDGEQETIPVVPDEYGEQPQPSHLNGYSAGVAAVDDPPEEVAVVSPPDAEETVTEPVNAGTVEAPASIQISVDSADAAAQEKPAAAPPATQADSVAVVPTVETKAPRYFRRERFYILVVVLALLSFLVYFTLSAQRGKDMFIRRIAGLSALEEAVGRATEMGRGILYIPGIADMSDIQTIAGVTILGHVAKKTAEYDTPLYAPMTRSFVMSVAQEVVKQAYLEKGRPDAFRPDRIGYLTDDQFGFVAGVGGIMMREKPAACFYLGTFFAESLILAETGNSVGAIQIAGTAEPSQIPFFVAACDYTLIGEELYAASAYLSRTPREVGSLKGQDTGKILIIFAIIIGTALVTVVQTPLATSFPMLAELSEMYMEIIGGASQ